MFAYRDMYILSMSGSLVEVSYYKIMQVSSGALRKTNYDLIKFIISLYRNYCLDQPTVLPTKSDSDAMFCLQKYQGLRIERSLVY